MKDQRKAEEIATERLQLILPLLADGLDAAQARQIKASICQQTGISERTLRRYIDRYRSKGFDGLKPKGQGRPRSQAALPDNILEEAILLRRQVPGRSIAQIIQILEWEGLAAPGQIKRSTLQDRLTERGYSARHMRMYAETGTAARRFEKKFRNQLWHSDVKYGPYLPIGKDGSKKQVYLVTFIDDATRYVLHGQFYPMLDKTIVEDCFRQAIHKYGIPQATYFDNGVQYRTKWMARTCSKMGIRLVYAKPYSPESTGKVERFNRTVDSFLAEAALEKPQTLDHLNEMFGIWLDECYQNKPHTALGKEVSPSGAFNSDSKALKFLDPSVIANAFLHTEERRVDKVGCISFQNKKYEVGLAFIGCKVTVVYDPADTTTLTIEYEGHAPWQAKQLVIGERAGSRPSLPEHLRPEPVESSRLLTAAAKRNRQRIEKQTPAVSYRSVRKEGAHHV